jgi:flagellar hook-associated protein 2
MAAGLNFTGLASGIDTNAIVTALMAVERRPVDVLQRRADLAGARLTGLAAMRAKLDALRGAEQALRGAGVFTPRPVATSSDGARVAATATATAVKGSFAVTVEALARADVKTQSTSLAAAGADDVLHVASGGTTFDVAVAAGDGIAAIAAKINGANGGVAASVVDGRLRIGAGTTGAAAAVALTSDGSLAGDLGMAVTLAGQDARYTVDGVAATSASNRVADGIPGVTLDLRAVTAGAAITVTADPFAVDADGVIGRAKALVTAYNATIDALSSAVREKPDASGSTPAKGAFYGDDLYQDLLAKLNGAVTSPVAGLASSRNQAAAVGLSTGVSTGAISADALSGRLVLDESKLRDAVASDPDGVAALLGGDGPQGIAARLDGVLTGLTSSTGLLTGRVAAETARLGGYRASIDDANVRLTKRETYLRAQFTAMETALGQLHDLQSRLNSQLGAAA